MGLNDCFADCQAKARMAFTPGSRLVSPVEPFENVRQVLAGDSGSGVEHRQNGTTVLKPGHDPHLASVAVELNGIDQQIGNHLAEPIGITNAAGWPEVGLDSNILLRGQGTD